MRVKWCGTVSLIRLQVGAGSWLLTEPLTLGGLLSLSLSFNRHILLKVFVAF